MWHPLVSEVYSFYTLPVDNKKYKSKTNDSGLPKNGTFNFPVDTIFFSYENNVIFRIDENNPVQRVEWHISTFNVAWHTVQHLLNNSCNICWSTNVEPCITSLRLTNHEQCIFTSNCQLYCQFSLVNLCGLKSLCDIRRDCCHNFVSERDFGRDVQRICQAEWYLSPLVGIKRAS